MSVVYAPSIHPSIHRLFTPPPAAASSLPVGERGGLAGSGAIDAHAFTIKVAKEEEKKKKKECGRPTEYNNGGDSNMACAKRGEAGEAISPDKRYWRCPIG